MCANDVPWHYMALQGLWTSNWDCVNSGSCLTFVSSHVGFSPPHARRQSSNLALFTSAGRFLLLILLLVDAFFPGNLSQWNNLLVGREARPSNPHLEEEGCTRNLSCLRGAYCYINNVMLLCLCQCSMKRTSIHYSMNIITLVSRL